MVEHKEIPNADAALKVLDELKAGTKLYEKAYNDSTAKYNALYEEFKALKSEKDADRLQLKLVSDTLAAYELKGKAPGMAAHGAEATKDFVDNYIRKGIAPTAYKAINETNDVQGGYLVPPEFSANIILLMKDISAMRKYANVLPIGSSELHIPKESDIPTASWEGETQSIGDSSPTGNEFGEEVLRVMRLTSDVPISNNSLEDSIFDVEAYLSQRVALAYALAEGTAFVNGTGVGQPEGFLQNATLLAKAITGTNHSSGVEQVGPASAAQYQLCFSDFINLWQSIATAYDANAAWFVNKTTLGTMRSFRSTTGFPLWQPAVAAGMPSTFDGIPVAFMYDMPSAAKTTGLHPVVYGDMKAAYTIADRKGMTAIRDIYSLKKTNQTEFLFRSRVGGQLVQPNALAIISL